MARSEGAPVSVRLAVTGGADAKREFDSFGASGKKSLKDLEDAARHASPALLAVDAASREVQDGAEGLAHHAGAVGRVLSELGPAGIAMGVGIGAGVLAIHKAVDIAKEAVESFDALHDKIENLGVDSDLFQGLQFQANLKGVNDEQFTAAIKNAQLRFGELELGIGRTTKQLTTYDATLAKDLKTAGSFEERLKLVSDAMEKETDSTKKNLLAKMVFGEANTRMAQVLDGGADSIDRFIEEAKAFGVVVDRQVLERADKMADQMDIASKVIDINLKQAFIDLAPVMITALNIAGAVAAKIADIVDETRALQDRTREGPLQDELKALSDRLVELRAQQASGETDIVIPHPFGKGVVSEVKSLDDEIASVQGHLKEVGARLHDLYVPPPSDPLKQATANAGNLQTITESIDRALEGVANKPEKIAAVNEKLAETIAQLEAFRNKPGADNAEIDADIVKAREVAQRQIDKLNASETKHAATVNAQTEKELSGLAARYSAQKKYNDLVVDLARTQKAGYLSESEYQSALLQAQKDLTDALEKQTEKELEATNTFASGAKLGLMKVADDAKDVAGQMSDAIKSAFDGATDALVDFVMTGKANFADLADSIIRDILRIAIQKAIVGPIAGALSGAFGGIGGADVTGLPNWGGPRDAGGSAVPGMLYEIGKGPYREIFSPRVPGDITPMSKAGGSPFDTGGGSLHVSFSLDGARGDREIEDLVQQGIVAALATYDQAFPGKVRGQLGQMVRPPVRGRF